MRRLAAVLLLALGLGGSSTAAQLSTPRPATELPRPELSALALEPGTLFVSAEDTATVRSTFPAGAVFVYYGETNDTFGRTWSVVGDPAAWRRERRWLVLPEEFARSAAPGETLAFVDTLGSPTGAAGATRRAVRAPSDWWKDPLELTVAERPQPGELLGVPAYRVPEEILDEVLDLAGGLDNLGPYPEEPQRGRIHIGRFLPMVFFWDGDWSLGDAPRTLDPVLGLLGNPLLVPDRQAPEEMIGLPVPCWSLIGALDAAGVAVGSTNEAPEEPAAVSGSARGADPLGARDFSRLAWPVADEEVASPRRVLLQGPEPGVLIADGSTRQAVYLEQVLPVEVTAELRGRAIRLRAWARAEAQAETTSSVPVAIEIVAGSVRETVATQVGPRSTPLTLEVTVPEDADDIRVRLLPQDRSIAVAERGRAIFDRVSLAPSDWPAELTPDPLPLRRTMVVGYESMRAYTRADLAISSRDAGSLAGVYPRLGDRPLDLQRDILAGRLAVGMSPEDVRLAWGEAEAIESTDGLLRWEWPDRSAAFTDESLLAWTTTPEAAPEEVGRCRAPQGESQ